MYLIFKKFFGHLISKSIVQAQKFKKIIKSIKPIASTDSTEIAEIAEIVEKNIKIKSTGKAIIDAVEVCHRELDCKSTEQKVIIYAYGRKDYYERHLADYYQEALELKTCRVVGFNFRNVQASTGKPLCEQDWIDDAIAVVDYYHKTLNIPLENILISGHSMGAALVTVAAAQVFQREKSKSIKIINNRSFSSLPAIVINLTFGGFGSGVFIGIISAATIAIVGSFILGPVALVLAFGVLECSLLGGLIFPSLTKALCRPITEIILYLTFGRIDALAAFHSLPKDSKDYIYAKDDEIIIGTASLAYALKAERKKEKAQAKLVGDHDKLKELRSRKLMPAPISPDQATMHKSPSYAHDLNLFKMRTASPKIAEDDALDGQTVHRTMVRRLLKL